MNIAEIILKLQDIVDAPFSAETFALQLIEAYGPPKATLAKLRQGTLNKAEREGDLIWTKKLHCRISSEGNAPEELDVLREAWSAKKNVPRFLVVTDGRELAALDTKLDDALNLTLAALTSRYDFFLPLAGVERYKGVPDSPADIKAAGTLAKFYDAILEANPEWTGHQRVHEIHLFLTRILFCLFAQSTGIFPKNWPARSFVPVTS